MTQQSITILNFIHSFRFVTIRHVQLFLQHNTSPSTYKSLRHLEGKGLIARHSVGSNSDVKIDTSYYLTPAGLDELKRHATRKHYRLRRALEFDTSASIQRRLRYHTLADVYTYFKQHYPGQFGMNTDIDLTRLKVRPSYIPDGFLTITKADESREHYLIEILGWDRSTQDQARRLQSYFDFAGRTIWDHTGETCPNVYLVMADYRTQLRVIAQLRNRVQGSLSSLRFYTTTAAQLRSSEVAIWREITS